VTARAILLVPVLGVVALSPLAFDFHAVKYVALMSGCAIAFALLLWRERRLAWTGASAAFWLFVAVRAAMLLRSPLSGESLRHLALLVALGLLAHAASALRSELRGPAAWVLGGLGGVAALYAIAQALGPARQAHSFFANRNFAGAGLAMLLPWAMRTRWRWPLLLLLLLGIAATESRGGALAGAVALALTMPRWRRPLLLGLPVAVVAGGLLWGPGNTIEVRKVWYRAAVAMGLDHPLQGLGSGGFAREYPPVRPRIEHAISGGRTVHAVHNDYLESFAEGGFPALLTHLLWVGATLFALRRSPGPFASFAAFSTASLVDLPLRDPSLLALALLAAGFALRQRRGSHPGVGAICLGVVVALSPIAWRHLLADLALARRPPDLAAVLRFEPDHPEGLLARGERGDLLRLLELEPHNANARYNLARWMGAGEAIAHHRETLLRHDPHHAPTRCHLAELVMAEDPLQAISILDLGIEADPRPFRLHLLLGRARRRLGSLDLSRAALVEAERRAPREPAVFREWLDLSLQQVHSGGGATGEIARAVSMLSAAEVRDRIAALFRRADEYEAAHPRPRVEREPEEEAPSHLRRIEEAQARWRRERLAAVAAPLREALLLSEALVASDPAAEHFRLAARAARGLDLLPQARLHDATAYLLDALSAVLCGEDRAARDHLAKALLGMPDLAGREEVRAAVRLFARSNPGLRAKLAALFADQPALQAASAE